MISYKEIHEQSDTHTGVLKYWQMQSPESVAIETHRLFPYGCAEILFPLEGTFSEYGQPPLQNGLPVFLGPLRSPTRVSVGGKVNLFGVRIAVGRAPLLLGGSVGEHVQQLSFPNALAPLEQLLEQLRETQILEARADLVRGALNHIATQPTEPEQQLFTAIDSIIEQHGKCTVDSIVDASGINKRGLERKFQHYVGVSPKRFIRIMRLKYVLDESGTDESRLRRVANIAMQAGFYDQAHFIKDFRNWMKETPTAFFEKHKSRLTGSFYKSDSPDESEAEK